MRRDFWVLGALWLLVIGTLNGQNLTYELRDSVTNDPIDNAYIYSKELNISTISNDEGAFDIPFLPKESADLIISHLFYGQLKVVLDSTSNNTILLKSFQYDLPEMVVADNVTYVDRVIRKTISSKLSKYRSTGYFRQFHVINDNHASVLESIIDLERNGLAIHQWKIKEARHGSLKKYESMVNSNYSYFTRGFKMVQEIDDAMIKLPMNPNWKKYFDVETIYKKDALRCYKFQQRSDAPEKHIYGNGYYLVDTLGRIHSFKLVVRDMRAIAAQKAVHLSEPEIHIRGNCQKTKKDKINVLSSYNVDVKIHLKSDEGEDFKQEVKSTFLAYDNEKIYKYRRRLPLNVGLYDMRDLKAIKKRRYRARFWRKFKPIRDIAAQKSLIDQLEEDNRFN